VTVVEVTVHAEVMAALHTVIDPGHGCVHSVLIDGTGVQVHLRPATATCPPHLGYLMVSDALDALRAIEGLGEVRVLLDGHHHSETINGSYQSPERWRTFLHAAHTAAMRRCVTGLLSQNMLADNTTSHLTLRDLPAGKDKAALLRRRLDLGLSICPNSRVPVGEHGPGTPYVNTTSL
jgi:metal-sulfur cluster biosynthetic enzyme